ncbi:hypothetical protein A5849_002188 [Enterococcus sp. 10F3_DIV0382]|nr:hypothetical protein A5849_002188 [Enterococcus sp. 10F3_DIV0382]
MLPNIGYYVQSIDQIVKETEAIGEGMHPKYEVIRNAIDEGKQVNWTDRLLKRPSSYLKKEQKNIGQCLRKSVHCAHQQKQWAFIKILKKLIFHM